MSNVRSNCTTEADLTIPTLFGVVVGHACSLLFQNNLAAYTEQISVFNVNIIPIETQYKMTVDSQVQTNI